MTPRPITVDEAAYTPTRGKRHGRQRGAWVYLDALLLERAGIAIGTDFEVMRYALVSRVRRKDGSEHVRGRIVLNLRIVGPTERRPKGATP